VVGQVDEDAATLHALVGHVLQAEMMGEAAVVAPVPGGVGCGPTRSTPARYRCSRRLVDPVAVGVELGADMGQRVPLVEYCSDRVTTSSAQTSTYFGFPQLSISLMWML